MLKNLFISSFIIIDKMKIDFYDGMSSLTGETGAGKSIIIDALGQLCGNRSSISLIKKNASKAVIEGIFDVHITPTLEHLCDELHIEIDDQFIISKEILKSGKSNIKINYQNSSNHALKLLMPHILDIHSQFETQKLFEEKNHILLLDEYASQDMMDLKIQYSSLYQNYQSLVQQLKEAVEEDLSDEQLEFLESQIEEIDECPYNDDEVDEMEKELQMLENYEKVNEHIQEFQHLMNSTQGCMPLLKEAIHHLEAINDYGDFQDDYEKIYDQYYELYDHYENIIDIHHQNHFDEYRFNELQETLYQVNRLKRKYGFTMDRIQEKREDIEQQIQKIKHRDEYIHDLEEKITKSKKQCLTLAKQIHNIRKEYALQFEKDILKELKSLYLEKAIFQIKFIETDLTRNGIDKIQFLVSINQGQDLSLLNESASGGEISRIMLAIKTIILQYSSIETIIFDEADTGVSGKVASSIGEKMKKLARKKQVLCITHLPQVASIADYQYSIRKKNSNDETLTSMKLLTDEERVVEIAKMLSNEQVTPEAIENAKTLLHV